MYLKFSALIFFQFTVAAVHCTCTLHVHKYIMYMQDKIYITGVCMYIQYMQSLYTCICMSKECEIGSSISIRNIFTHIKVCSCWYCRWKWWYHTISEFMYNIYTWHAAQLPILMYRLHCLLNGISNELRPPPKGRGADKHSNGVWIIQLWQNFNLQGQRKWTLV